LLFSFFGYQLDTHFAFITMRSMHTCLQTFTPISWTNTLTLCNQHFWPAISFSSCSLFLGKQWSYIIWGMSSALYIIVSFM
jgi:hypothetical protein